MAHVLISALKNEGPFLLEWVAYHRAIGFDRIIIAHNDCDDGSVELLAALEALGWVTALENSVPEGMAPQQSAARLIAEEAGLTAGDWVLWIDLDEFVNVHAGQRRITDLTEALGPAWGMLIPWRLMGDSGVTDWPGRFIDAAFTRCAAPADEMTWAVKTLFRFGPEVTRLDIHRPYLAEASGLDFDDVRAAHGGPISRRWGPHHRWLSGIDPRSYPRIGREDKSWQLAQINHYAVRTAPLWAMKKRRGRGYWAEDKDGAKTRHTAGLFARLNLNHDTDDTILHWQDATTALMDQAAKDPAVTKAQTLIAARLQETLSSPNPESAPAVPDGLPALPRMHFPEAATGTVADAYRQADTILEYGSGGSTVFAARETSAHLVSIESDAKWADDLRAGLIAHGLMRPGIDLRHIDIGPTKAWGKPAGAASWHRFHAYPLQPWSDPGFSPDLVLIDGRFRLACFAAVLLNTKVPVTILWDDYVGRPEYHDATLFAEPVALSGRLARFEIEPRIYAGTDVSRMIAWFFQTR